MGKDDTIDNAIEKIRNYVEEITGQSPSDEEISRSLTRYFTLREIAAHIRMERDED